MQATFVIVFGRSFKHFYCHKIIRQHCVETNITWLEHLFTSVPGYRCRRKEDNVVRRFMQNIFLVLAHFLLELMSSFWANQNTACVHVWPVTKGALRIFSDLAKWRHFKGEETFFFFFTTFRCMLSLKNGQKHSAFFCSISYQIRHS